MPTKDYVERYERKLARLREQERKLRLALAAKNKPPRPCAPVRVQVTIKISGDAFVVFGD